MYIRKISISTSLMFLIIIISFIPFPSNQSIFNNLRLVGRIAQLVEQRARNRKVASSNPVKAYQTFHPSEVDKLVPVVVWPSGLRRGLSM